MLAWRSWAARGALGAALVLPPPRPSLSEPGRIRAFPKGCVACRCGVLYEKSMPAWGGALGGGGGWGGGAIRDASRGPVSFSPAPCPSPPLGAPCASPSQDHSHFGLIRHSLPSPSRRTAGRGPRRPRRWPRPGDLAAGPAGRVYKGVASRGQAVGKPWTRRVLGDVRAERVLLWVAAGGLMARRRKRKRGVGWLCRAGRHPHIFLFNEFLPRPPLPIRVPSLPLSASNLSPSHSVPLPRLLVLCNIFTCDSIIRTIYFPRSAVFGAAPCRGPWHPLAAARDGGAAAAPPARRSAPRSAPWRTRPGQPRPARPREPHVSQPSPRPG